MCIKRLYRIKTEHQTPKPHVIYFGVKYSISSAKKANLLGF